jgi:hypothetical protein
MSAPSYWKRRRKPAGPVSGHRRHAGPR